MKRLLLIVATITVSAQLGASVLEACGTKFLVATRSAQLQRQQRATRPAKVLVYQHDNAAGVIEFVVSLQDALEGVGHKVRVAAGEPALRNAAQNGDFNVVMLQLDAARRLKGDLRSWLPNATILPMGEFVTRSAAATAKEEFGRMLTLPAKISELFSVVQAAYR